MEYKTHTVRFPVEVYEQMKRQHLEYCHKKGEVISLNAYMVMKLVSPNAQQVKTRKELEETCKELWGETYQLPD